LQEISKGKRESTALAIAFARTDKELRKSEVAGDSGATAVVALVRHRDDGKWVYVANCGDARATIIRSGGGAVQISKDHKPTDPDEAEKLKGKTFVTGGKVGGVLGVSRAFGDFSLKEYITVEPQIAKTEITPHDSALIIACDGLWDVCSNNDVSQITKGLPTAQAMAEELVKQALERGSTDNVSVLVVLL
jgi:serine/threonine protein phosphatase PrpC